MDSSEHKKLAQAVYKKTYLRGHFKLRSGTFSDEYFDKYQIESDPELLEKISEALIPLIPSHIEVLAGLTLGGIPLATALSLKLKKPLSFVRKKAKSYGTCKLAEGACIENKKICIIEDVITTGGQVVKSAKALRKNKAQITDVVCLILRDTKAIDILKKENLNLHFLFQKSDFSSSC